ncbi:disco-interacting protein 2 isoform X2 [Sitodiplosis mosellana]|uniref:disco-interacting protein 2 isoform X2 n=1 Tax=Sitodiplosis mosellana TaxID=263140 RepID=UPI0024449D2A|nr:disco-interacting protein 2 isoform X2 [Sitodiplosis mosellana]
MKAISFEAIRNLLRTKKKSADDYGDASFKRSDSFKRISIRRSYLNRGRKRAIHASKSSAHNANQNGKIHASVGAVVTAGVIVQEPSSERNRVEHKVPFTDQHVNVQVNSSVREPINISSRVEEAIQQNYRRCSEIEANIKNVKNKSSKESIRNSVESSISTDIASATSGGAAAAAADDDDERFKVQRRSSNKSRQNKYEEVTTSTSCFVKAGNMLKKPIGTGLDVTTADSIDRAVNLRYSSHRDPFYDILRNSQCEFDPNQKHRSDHKSRPKSFAPHDVVQQQQEQQQQQQQQQQMNRVCIRQPASNNSSKRSSDFVNFNDSTMENIWSAPAAQQFQSNPVINKSTFNTCNEDNARNPENEMPSFVIFKTFSNELNSNGYLETCFNNVDDESKKRKDVATATATALQCNTYTKKYNDVTATVVAAAAAAAAAAHRDDLSSNRKGNGVVIQISDSGCNIDNLSHLQIKEALNKKVSRDSALGGDNLHDYSEDETSLNGKFTFEIYKQIRTNKKSEDPLRSKYTMNNYDKSALKPFGLHKAIGNLDPSETVTQNRRTLDESFASMHICDKIVDNNFFLEPDDTHEYNNDVNVIPYPLRIKTNPFTNQKEPYSVNLGRVWKQLNLGQDDHSLETSIEKSNSKVKNDSFRSISSHDSGFSLTLTKQKSLFNRKQQKKSSKHKSKATLTRDGQFKKLSAFQSNGVRHSKKNQFKQRTSPSNSKFQLKLGKEERKTKKSLLSSSSIVAPAKSNIKLETEKNPCETFLNRYYSEIQQKLQPDDEKSTDYSFSQEISDLEAFFEEHLKRLKEYYLQKKRINDQTLDEICSKCEGKRTEPKLLATARTESNQPEDNSFVQNSSGVYLNSRLHKRKNGNGGDTAIEIIPNDGTTNLNFKNKLSYGGLCNYDASNFDFPYPDKRIGTNTRRNNRRLYPMNEIRVSNDLEYASLDFNSHLQSGKHEAAASAWNSELASEYLQHEHLKHLTLDDDFLKEKQSMIVNYNSAGEFLLDDDVSNDNDDDDDEYEDILNDDEHATIDGGICVLCDKIQPECECSMNRKLANAYSITPENSLCNCMAALNTPMLKPNYAKNSKTVKKSSSSGKSRLNSRKAKRSKRKKWHASKNHSLRREYCNVASDITQKGYEKKRSRLLQPYLPKNPPSNDGYYNLQKNNGGNSGGGGSGGGNVVNSEGYSYVDEVPSLQSTQHRQQQQSQQKSMSSSHRDQQAQNRARRAQRRVTHNEKRYHSEVRQEAVQQALAALKNRPKPSLPMPSKRSSVLNRSPDRNRDDSADSSSDDASIPEERIATPDREYNYPRDHLCNSRDKIKMPSQRDNSERRHQNNASERRPQNLPPPQSMSDTSSTGSPPAVHRNNKTSAYDLTDVPDFQQPHVRPYAAPDITQFNNTRRGADRVTRYVNVSQTDAGDTGTTGRWKVSAKIQQLLNTLKRPKRRPLPEFYEDNDIELEIAANPKDPNAPKPEGLTMTPVHGEQLVVPSGLPRTLEAALQRYGSSSFKAPMATVLDPNGKNLTTTLTYGKLLSRAMKIAYALSTKVFSKGPESITLKAGDTVALVYPNNDPLNFITAWYGCMFRGLVPLPIELPLSSSDSPPQQIGFLLSSCGIQVALTSEACLKGLPKSSTGEIAKLKGWPRLQWFVTEHLPKPPKDFNVNNARINEDGNAYIEYTTDKEGSVMGVTVKRDAMMNHCRALTMACHYTEGETVVCVLDFKREVGLWHSVLTSVLNGIHVLFIPYALMKLRPSSWMQLITKYRASCCLVKSRDLHWGLLATKDHKDISLSSLRMLLVADGANPWSLSSCDQFLSVFQAKGLRPDAICPCASSSEAFTVSLRRPGRGTHGGFSQSATGRGVLSMAALSHGVVRVDSEDSLTSLTLQDCGQVMPGTNMVVVRSEGPSVLCKTDQVGEICVTSGATGNTYFGLDGMTNSTFKVQPSIEEPDAKSENSTIATKPIGDDKNYVRSGLLGFLGPSGLVFICGSRDGLMTVTGRKHNADDIIATVLAVEPMRFIYRGRIAVFSIKVLRDERVCVIAEQRPDCSEEESFQWMSRVLQAVDSIHQVGIYCLALVPPNHLPKTPLGGIHLCEARRRFLEGSLHPANVLMCPHTCVTNLPKPRELHHGALQATQNTGSSSGCVTDTSVGPASVMVGNLVQGNRLAVAQGRDIGFSDDGERKHQLITGVLRWRANTSPDHVVYTLLNSKGAIAKTLTCSELHKRAEKIAALLQERGKINPGDHVALIFPPGLDLICAFYGCLYLGATPVTIRPPHPQNLITTLPTVRMIVDVSKSGIVLSIQSIIKLLKTREAAASIDPKSWPPILDIDDNPKRKLASIANSSLDSTAYLDFSVSTCGRLSGVIMTHRSLSSVCASLKLACELYPSRHVALCLDPYCGLGFIMWTLIGVYSGHHSLLIAPYEVEANPSLWLSTLSQYRVRDTFCSYGVIELCTKALSNSIQVLKQRNINLGCVRTCVVVAEERPRVQLTQQFCKLFQALGLNTRCVSTSFGCRVNPAICVQGASSAESAQVYVDLRALRNNRVALVERGAPNSLCLIESGKLLPGVKVIIANPDTKGHCGDSHLGEIWVQSPHTANGYFTIYGDEKDYNDHFNAKLVTGATTEVYARTGYLGFLRRTECSQASSVLDETTPSIASRDSDTESLHSQGTIHSQNAPGVGVNASFNNEHELHDAVYVVGALDEVITLRGMNYHPIDIENSVLRCHKKIAECAVFTWTNLLVVVVELDGNESEALDLVPLVTNTVLEEHQLIVGVVVVVDPGVVPINSRGEKQRMHLRDGFLADQLDPIYVAYNM